MPQTQFKLSKLDGHTRRIVFPDLPTWEALASRLEHLYAIPLDKIGVSYIDNDNDEITLSSNNELQDFYRLSHRSNEVIKFAVLDLRSSRDGQKSEAPPNRNTFGHESFDLDDDWQRLPTIHGISDLFLGRTLGVESPHAFVEVIDSDANSVSPSVDNASDNQTDDEYSAVQPTCEIPKSDKGKAKDVSSPSGTVAAAAASTVSMIAEESPFKHPIHVYDLHSQNPASSSSPPQNTNNNITAESTPKANAQDLNSREPQESSRVDLPALPEVIEDPPLPTTGDAVNTSPSLSHDIAALLTSLTTVVSAHPELSEGLRNIIRNATSGVYWQVHGEALSQAVTDIAQSVELSSNEVRRNVESEAERRISEVLGRMLRSLSEGQANPTPDLPANPVTDDSRHGAQLSASSAWYGPPRANFARHRMRGHPPIPGISNTRPGWGFWGGPPPVRAHTYHAHGPSFRHGSPHSTAVRNDYRHHDSQDHQIPVPPGPPPPLGSPSQISPVLPPSPAPNPLPKVTPPAPTSTSPVEQPPISGPAAAEELRPPRPLPRPNNFPHAGNSPHDVGLAPYDFPPFYYNSSGGAYPPHLPPPRGFSTSHPLPPPPPPPPHSPWGFRAYNPRPPSGSSEPSKPSPQELRAQVEAAKLLYKAEKERYRQEKEERKKDRDRNIANSENAAIQHTTEPQPVLSTSSPLGDNSAPEVPVQIISNARGPYPQLEMFSVPRRHNTHLGHGSSHKRGEKTSEDLTARALSRITKRLADMGFTQSSYPLLPSQIKAQMPANGVISKDEEDNLVTTLLEELLAMSPKPAFASGSKEKDIPGAWH